MHAHAPLTALCGGGEAEEKWRGESTLRARHGYRAPQSQLAVLLMPLALRLASFVDFEGRMEFLRGVLFRIERTLKRPNPFFGLAASSAVIRPCNIHIGAYSHIYSISSIQTGWSCGRISVRCGVSSNVWVED
jgi:hypothetical protein